MPKTCRSHILGKKCLCKTCVSSLLGKKAKSFDCTGFLDSSRSARDASVEYNGSMKHSSDISTASASSSSYSSILSSQSFSLRKYSFDEHALSEASSSTHEFHYQVLTPSCKPRPRTTLSTGNPRLATLSRSSRAIRSLVDFGTRSNPTMSPLKEAASDAESTMFHVCDAPVQRSTTSPFLQGSDSQQGTYDENNNIHDSVSSPWGQHIDLFLNDDSYPIYDSTKHHHRSNGHISDIRWIPFPSFSDLKSSPYSLRPSRHRLRANSTHSHSQTSSKPLPDTIVEEVTWSSLSSMATPLQREASSCDLLVSDLFHLQV